LLRRNCNFNSNQDTTNPVVVRYFHGRDPLQSAERISCMTTVVSGTPNREHIRYTIPPKILCETILDLQRP
jgi:hypothetical protein